MRLYVIAALCLAFLAGGGASGWAARGWKAAADDQQRRDDEAEAARLNARQVDGAAQALEVKRAATEIRWRTVVKEVDRVVETPVYRNLCLDDDGLRLIAAEVGARAASQPAPAVPSASAAGAH